MENFFLIFMLIPFILMFNQIGADSRVKGRGVRYTFVGRHGSMGLTHGRRYRINVIIWPSGRVDAQMRKRFDFAGVDTWRCPYESIEEFRENWKYV